jgi:hypothetical protein
MEVEKASGWSKEKVFCDYENKYSIMCTTIAVQHIFHNSVYTIYLYLSNQNQKVNKIYTFPFFSGHNSITLT